MSVRFAVEKPDGSFEDVGAYEVHFAHTHVVFMDEAGELVVAYRASDVVTVVKEEEE